MIRAALAVVAVIAAVREIIRYHLVIGEVMTIAGWTAVALCVLLIAGLGAWLVLSSLPARQGPAAAPPEPPVGQVLAQMGPCELEHDEALERELCRVLDETGERVWDS